MLLAELCPFKVYTLKFSHPEPQNATSWRQDLGRGLG